MYCKNDVGLPDDERKVITQGAIDDVLRVTQARPVTIVCGLVGMGCAVTLPNPGWPQRAVDILQQANARGLVEVEEEVREQHHVAGAVADGPEKNVVAWFG